MRTNTVASEVLKFLLCNPGHTDGEINLLLFGGAKNHAHINITCRGLVDQGLIARKQRSDGKLGNYPSAPGEAQPQLSQGVEHRSDIFRRVDRFLEDAKKPNHRYLSWDYCFEFFRNREQIRGSAELKDLASLHLAWFLASWGMLRGSGDLLWKNHTFLAPVVEALIQPEFDQLLAFDPLKTDKDLLLDLLLGTNGLDRAIRKGFVTLDPSFSASDILVTKVLLGTTACSMAFDQYVVGGLKECGLTGKYGKRALGGAFDFYVRHQDQFKDVDANGYPPFKLLDMYFFDFGMEASGEL